MAREKRAAWFKLGYHLRPAAEVCSDAEIGAALRAALRRFDGEAVDERELPGKALVLFALLGDAVDEALSEYNAAVSAGKRRGGPQPPSRPLRGPQGPSGSLTEEDKDGEEEKKEEEKERAAEPQARPSFPPTLEDVQAFAEARGSPVDPQRFYDYFAAGGWLGRDGKPLTSWQQVLIGWERKEGGNAHGLSQSGAAAGGAGVNAAGDAGWQPVNDLDN